MAKTGMWSVGNKETGRSTWVLKRSEPTNLRPTICKFGRFSRRNPMSGFTLMEMLLVLVIAVVAMALVVPNLSKGIDSVRLRGSAREIASSFRYLRGYAVSQNTESEFNINVETNRYRITGREKAYKVPESIKISLVTADSEISGEDNGTIRFYPDGSSSGGRVSLANGKTRRLIDVNWLTGNVEEFIEKDQ